MEKSKKLKIVGACMCVPLPVMVIYLIMHPGILVVALLTALSSLMLNYGIKLVKGASVTDLKNEIAKDIDKIND